MKNLIVKALVLIMVAAAGLSGTGFAQSVYAAEDETQTETTEDTTQVKKVKVSKGQKVVKKAKKYIGNRYVYGGSSLTRGVDCSGFVRGIYKKFGKNLPHSSSSLRRVGKKVKGGLKNAKAGDIICYSGHVAIFMGKGKKIIHASNSAPYPRGGIKVSKNAGYRRVVAVRRIFKAK